MAEAPLPRPNLRERLLGAFVCFQLIAIPLGSYIKLIPVRLPEHRGELMGDLQEPVSDPSLCREPMQTVKDSIAYAVSRWAEVSGLGQSWALFATFGKQSAFPVVELRWGDGRPAVELYSHFEPKDPSSYFYPPEPMCRLFNYEYRMVIGHWIWQEDLKAKEPEQYRGESLRVVRDMRRSLSTFLKWRVEQYLQQHSDAPTPDDVVLKAHILPNPSPGSSRLDRPEAFFIPVARWRPLASESHEYLALEAWDPLAGEFVRLPITEGQR